jgi:CRP-like cAMP-binding protein
LDEQEVNKRGGKCCVSQTASQHPAAAASFKGRNFAFGATSMENVAKRLYMREHSNVIRKFQSMKLLDKMEENPIFNIEGTNRLIIVTICRIRQRTLTHAWRRLVRNTRVRHDYETDAKVILSRKLPDEELRTELEIEVLFNWIYSTKDIDPTGIANTIFLCKKRSAIYNALQQLRLEFYEPGETVLFQGDIPRPEDGHFTIFNGSCDVVQFPDESMPLMKLLYLAKKKKWDEARKLLTQAIVLARITKGSGFGELSTLTGVKRAATIRTDASSTTPTEIVVLPKQALLDCLKSRRQDGVQGAAPSEAMDFMRQSGLANRISPKDLVRVAQNMVRRTLLQGEILYFKGETVKSLFLVVSGELLLDTGDFLVDGKPEAFINSNPDNCYHMSSGSILGDEGVVGQSNRFSSTAVVVSDAAVVFEAVGFSMNFLTEKISALRYCALTYRDKSRWSAPIHLAEEINPYTYFHSLRKAIAYTHPYRGSRPRIYDDVTASEDAAGSKTAGASAKIRRAGTKSGKHKPQSNIKKLSPLVRMDSNLAYMLTTEQHDNPAPVTEFSFPRTLKPVGLHHALDINRIAKRLAQKFVKVHAQVSVFLSPSVLLEALVFDALCPLSVVTFRKTFCTMR